MHRIAADRPGAIDPAGLPKNAPTTRLPPGYQVSCCTSASSPYAAGVVALLLSAARQERVAWSYESVARALRNGARFLPGFQSYQQGNGVLDVEGAWRELTRRFDVPIVTSSGPIVHPLARYAATGARGEGLFEVGGWQANTTGERTIRFRRESGSAQPVTYRLDWTGNDGTFTTASSITLPLRADALVAIAIAPKTSGVHSALLNLRDAETGAIVHRTQAAIVASERLDWSTTSIRLRGTVGVMRATAHSVAIPAGVEALSVELHILRGRLRAIMVPNSSLAASYFQHIVTGAGQAPAGRYQFVVQSPGEGIWSIVLTNDAAMSAAQPDPASRDADYELIVSLAGATVRVDAAQGGHGILVSVGNRGSTIEEPSLEATQGILTSHTGRLQPSGLPTQIPIDVPPGTSTMRLDLRADSGTEDLELHLYECTTGQCFSDSLPLAAARGRTLVVRKPASGRWIAAVNAAPVRTGTGSFVLDAFVGNGPTRRLDRSSPLERGRTWTERLDLATGAPREPASAPVVLVELIDRALDRRESAQAERKDPQLPPRRDRPAFAGAAIYQLDPK